jgi:paraquat-inducible protein A
LANAFPVVAIQTTGNTVFASILGVTDALHEQNMNLVALVVLATTIVFPGLDLMSTCALLLFARWRHLSSALVWLFRLRSAIKPWSMIEIFVLGALVAIVKLGSIAIVTPGIGLWSLCTFIVLSAGVSHSFDPVEFWNESQS